MLLLDAGQRQLYINPEMQNYLGMDLGGLVEDDPLSLVATAESRPQWQAALHQAASGTRVPAFDLSIDSGLEARTLQVQVVAQRDAAGVPSGFLVVASDVTEARARERQLHAAKLRFEEVMDQAPVIAWIKDDGQRYVYRNKLHRNKFGIDEDWTGRLDSECLPQSVDADTIRNTDQRVLDSGLALDFELTQADDLAQTRRWWIHKFLVRGAGGERLIGGVGLDITATRGLESRLRDSEAQLQSFMEHSPSLAWMKDEEGRYTYLSRSYCTYLGIEQGQGRGLTDFDFFPAEFANECREIEQKVLAENRAHETRGPAPSPKGDRSEWLLLRYPFIGDSGHRYIGGLATDVTRYKQAEDVIRLQSLTDDLTGLYNRRGFLLLVEQEYRRACRNQQRCALLMIDMDDLKGINDRNGHEAGDFALMNLSEALRVAVRNSDILARLGGDEFVVFAADCKDPELLRARLERSLAGYNQFKDSAAPLAASIGGIGFIADAEVSFESLMAQADREMYQVKRQRKLRA